MSHSIEFWVERLLPCPCRALTDAPWSCCPECGGDGESYQEIALDIEYTAHRACRGARDRYGAQLEPDEDASVEIDSVTDANGIEVELTAHELDRAEEKCLADAEDSVIAAAEAWADARNER